MQPNGRPPETPGEMWDVLVASALQSSSGVASWPRRSNLATLRLMEEPVPRNAAWAQMFPWPAKERTVAGINPKLRAIFRALVSGEAAWPLFLWGPPGSGKTCAVLCLADHCPGAEYFKLPALCARLNQAQQRGLEYADEGRAVTIWPLQVWERIGKVRLVVLDEIGCRERVSDAHYEVAKDLVDEREGKPLVVVSNLDLEQLGKLYDGRLVSRLGAGTIFELQEADRRLEV